MKLVRARLPVCRTAFLLLFLLFAGSLFADKDKAENVLFIFSWHKDMPWQQEVERGFQQQIKSARTKPNLYFEYMDAGRAKSKNQAAIFRDYILKKYSNYSISRVVFESAPAARLFGSSPVQFGKMNPILLNPGANAERFLPLSTVIPVKIDIETAVRGALSFSGARTIYLVAGVSPGTQNRVKAVSEILARIAPDKKRVTFSGYPVDQLLPKLAHLEPDGIILYLLQFEDRNGNRYVPFEAARRISEGANIPTYSFWTSLLGSGVVGGYMLSGERVGRVAATLVMENVFGNSPGPANSMDQFHGYYFDWNQLKRWGIRESRLPEGSTVLFRQPNMLEEYKLEFSVAIVVLVLLFVSIRYRELRMHNRKLDLAHQDLQTANDELSRVKLRLEERNELLRGLSITDSLTGLYNRGYLDEKIRDEIRRIDRYGDGLSIILVDIDHFKQINDRFGHQKGDDVLIRVARILQENIRNTDAIGRWGGEEFVIVCPNLDDQQSVQMAEKLREIIERTGKEAEIPVTCSFGVASFIVGTDELRLMRDADKALYASKNSGRNCVSSSTVVA